MSRNLKIIFSFIILIVGIIIFGSEYFKEKKNMVYDYMNELYYNEPINNNDDISLNENNSGDKPDTSYSFNENNENNESIYIGYLSIPKINLKKGFTKKDSPYNTINKNISILSASDYPDIENGNVIFAAHSGNSSVSYFNKLHNLSVGDVVIIEYNNIKYTYQIGNIYEVPKTGEVEIKRYKDVSNVTLITCTKNNNETQTVYVGVLINKE